MTKKNESEAQKYVEQKRKDRDKLIDSYSSLLDSVKDSFAGLGVASIQIGNELINTEDKDKSLAMSSDELYFTQEMNAGKPLFILSHINGSMYYADEKVQFSDRKIEELIDVDLVKKLAPNCFIYSPNANKPWQDVFSNPSYQLFITNEQELTNLYKEFKNWAKTKWHDDITTKEKHVHLAKDTFYISLISNIPKDIGWRHAQLVNAERKHEKLVEIGNWDSVSQTSFKKILCELVNVEHHPILGPEMQDLIEKFKPLLDNSMNGKKILKDSEKNLREMNISFNRAFNSESVSWEEWSGDYKKDFNY